MGYLDNAGLAYLWGKVKAALSNKQDKLAGQPGQAVGFDSSGKADAIQQWSNPNLLDNWYFADPINQRGAMKYTQAGYTIDRWSIENRDLVVKLEEKGISITRNAETGLFTFIQHTTLDEAKQLSGRTVTLSILTDTGLYSATDVFPSEESGNEIIFSTNENAFVSIIMFWDAKSYQLCRITVGNPIIIKAVKLELGAQQTLAHQDANGNWVLNDPPPNQALELLKCQRYYQVFSKEELRPTKAMDFRPPLRAAPALSTIEIDGVTCYTADANL